MANFQIPFGKTFKHVLGAIYKRIAQGFTISALKLESLMEAEIGRTTKETQPVSFEGGGFLLRFWFRKKINQEEKCTIGGKFILIPSCIYTV
jgi:hypothetical protein